MVFERYQLNVNFKFKMELMESTKDEHTTVLGKIGTSEMGVQLTKATHN